MKKIFIFSIILIILFGFILSVKGQQSGASLFISPSSGTFHVGSTFDISVLLNTGGNNINALRVDLNFDPKKLQVASPTAGRSFISVWISQPSYSNVTGQLTFQGGIPSPGINTSNGLVSTITFRAIAPGPTTISILNTSKVLLDDGKGTDVLSWLGRGMYEITLPPPEGPKVFSPTHPDQNKWYKNNNPSLNWEKEEWVTDFSYTIDKDFGGAPDSVSEGMGNSVSYADLEDGLWYFHIKAKKGGVWGGTSHYILRVDTTPPAAFSLEFEPALAAVMFTTQPIVSFMTTDALSGIDHYEIKSIALDLTEEGETGFFVEVVSPYRLSLDAGVHKVVIRAFDKAGNWRDSTESLQVIPKGKFIITKKGINFWIVFLPWWLLVLILVLLIIIILAIVILSRKYHLRVYKEKEKLKETKKKIENHKEKIIGRIKFLVIILFFITIPLVADAKGAYLYLDPPEESFDVGEEFYVSVKVSADFSINTVKAVLYFPQAQLEVIEISKQGSIFSLWAEEPKFSNEFGELSFVGGVPNPGFIGNDGQLISIKFKAEDRGSVKLNWGESAILANDGKGTDIFTHAKEGKYILEVLAPAILSSTHPVQEKWYKDKNPEFRWELFPDVTAVSYALNKEADFKPDKISEGRMNSKNYQELDDGVWYFHLRTKGDSDWSSTRHFRVGIDTIPPNPFEIVVNNEGDPTNPRPILYFDVDDEISGIEYYTIEFENRDRVILANPYINQYQLPIQAPGAHSIIVQAIDRAGNVRTNVAGVAIQPIEKPKIVLWPTTYVSGEEKFYAEGTALPENEVMLFLEKDDAIERLWEARANDKGEWIFSTMELLESGIYYLFAKAKDERGATSEFSPKQEIEVTFSGIALGSLLITFKNLTLILAVLLLFLIISAIYFARKNLSAKKTLSRETKEAEESLRRGFDELRRDIEREIEGLEIVKSKRELGEKEQEIIKNLREDLKEVEKYIGKEIKDIKI